MLRCPGPPQISLTSPLHLDVHLPGRLAELISSLPQKHWPPFSVPAYLAPSELQRSTQLLEVIWRPHHSGCFPSERGFSASRKQPAAFHTPDLLLTEAGSSPDVDPVFEGDPTLVYPGLEGAVDDCRTDVLTVVERAEVVCTTLLVVIAVAALTVEAEEELFEEADEELFEEAMGAATELAGATLPAAQFVGVVARPGPA